jgi:hypothetical protein
MLAGPSSKHRTQVGGRLHGGCCLLEIQLEVPTVVRIMLEGKIFKLKIKERTFM